MAQGGRVHAKLAHPICCFGLFERRTAHPAAFISLSCGHNHMTYIEKSISFGFFGTVR